MRAMIPGVRVTAFVLFASVVAAVTGLSAGCADPAMDERTPVSQEVSERDVAGGDFVIIDTLAADGPSFNPALVTVLADGDVLVYDAGSQRLVRYDDAGQIVARYGSGQGTGPGEHVRVVDIGAFDSGRVWSFDQQAGAVNVFEAGGEFARRIELSEPVHYLTARTADRLVGTNPAVESPFRVFDADGEIVDAFGWLLDDPGMQSVPYVGRVLPLEGGGFVYVMFSADIMKARDGEGDLLWHRMMIDGFEPPGVYVEEDGSAWLEHPNGRSTIIRVPLNTTDEQIHVFVMNSTAEIVFIDTYSVADGSYVGSRRVPVSEYACEPRYVRGTTAWMSCGGGDAGGVTLVRARIPEL